MLRLELEEWPFFLRNTRDYTHKVTTGDIKKLNECYYRPKGKTKFNLKIIVLKIFDQTNKNSERKQLQYVKIYFKYMHYLYC